MSNNTYPHGHNLPLADRLSVDEHEPWQIAAWYHQRSKHHFSHYAHAKGYMDWANQPVAFRWYDDAEQHQLGIPTDDVTPNYSALFSTHIAATPLTADSLSQFFYHSLAISAWKSYGGDSWALRCNPSSGNLHPTESYAFLPAMPSLTPCAGIFHYRPDTHALERRLSLDNTLWRQLSGGADGFYVALTSIHWRESWKYGERAFRYCQHDVGHAVAALRFAAAIHGWRLRILNTLDDESLKNVLGMQHTRYVEHEAEVPDLILYVAVTENSEPNIALNPEVLTGLEHAWHGRPNRLSQQHDTWQAIDSVHQHCQTSSMPSAEPCVINEPKQVTQTQSKHSCAHIIRTRRSAQAMDGVSTLTQSAFYRMLARTVPSLTTSPWDAQPWSTHVHLALFVHRVEHLTPGLYVLARHDDAITLLQQAMNPTFLWQPPKDCPTGLNLFLLQPGDVRQSAAQLSCEQSIASDGAFSLGMVAHFLPILKNQGAFWYRRLFWETGMIGQVLYLEAEDNGLQATGIGCFFDDPVHQLLGLTNMDWQSLYHFTLGGPIVDTRVSSKPAYPSRTAQKA